MCKEKRTAKGTRVGSAKGKRFLVPVGPPEAINRCTQTLFLYVIWVYINNILHIIHINIYIYYIYMYLHIQLNIYIFISRYIHLKATYMIPVASHSTPFSKSLPKQSSPFTTGSPPVCLGYVTEVARARQPQVSITTDQSLTWSPQVGTCIRRNHPHIEWNKHTSLVSPRKVSQSRSCARACKAGSLT